MVLLTMLVGISAPISASAQTLRGTSFTTANGDHSLTWNENWTASLEGDDEFATMVMLEGQIMIYAVMFIHDPLAGLNTKSVYYSLSSVLTSSFDSEPTQTVEWEGEDGSYHGANVIQLSGIDFLLYLRIDPSGSEDSGPIMQLAAAPVRAFPSSFEAMQTDIAVDGGPSLSGENGEDILARLDSGSASPVAAESDSKSAPAPAAARDSVAERERVPLRERPASATPVTTEYVSPANGYTVTYTDTWQDMAASSATVGEFSLSDTATGRTVVSFSGRSTTETNREAFFQDIVQRESRYPGFVGSVVTNDRLLIASWTDANELVVLEYVFVDDSTVVTIMVTVTSSSPDSAVTSVRDIQLNGDDILRDWDKIWPPEN
jgi:hypothetical protein